MYFWKISFSNQGFIHISCQCIKNNEEQNSKLKLKRPQVPFFFMESFYCADKMDFHYFVHFTFFNFARIPFVLAKTSNLSTVDSTEFKEILVRQTHRDPFKDVVMRYPHFLLFAPSSFIFMWENCCFTKSLWFILFTLKLTKASLWSR